MPTEAETARAALLNALASPYRMRGDAGEAYSHMLREYLEVDKHIANRDDGSGAGSRARRGMRITKLVPPGTE